MRQIMFGDLTALAARLCEVPADARRVLARRLLEQAHVADCYRKRFGRAHRRLGNGSLLAAVLQEGGPALTFRLDPDFLGCLAISSEEIARWRARPVGWQRTADTETEKNLPMLFLRECATLDKVKPHCKGEHHGRDKAKGRCS